MPPKKKANEPGKKTQEKAKAKVVEDKTFGMKNKKGAKQQKFIQQVQKTVMTAGKSAREIKLEQDAKNAKKDLKKKEILELNTLFKPVEQKIGKGVDPKSVLCAFFKAGKCSKGDKCKFSHDLNVARKSEKRNIFDGEEGAAEDNMADWDEAKLEEVIQKKHGESNKNKATTTTIVCKHFIDAVESAKYGWFWECPNGQDCKYKHAVPPGFVLKRDKKAADDKVEKISLEELVERERAALNADKLTRVTLESFMKWKAKKKQEKIKAFMKNKENKKKDLAQGKSSNISGREMFEFNPDLVAAEMDGEEGDADFDLSTYKRDDDDEEEGEGENKVTVVDIDLETLAASAREADDTGTKRDEPKKAEAAAATCNGTMDAAAGDSSQQERGDESNKLSMAAGGASSEDPGLQDQAAADITDDIDIDENLFDDEDLLEVDEELAQLDLDS